MTWTVELRDPSLGLVVATVKAETAAEATVKALANYPNARISRVIRGA